MSLTSLRPRGFRFPVLVGDVGGTNARFALVMDAVQPALALPAVATADFPDITAAIRASIAEAKAPQPKSAVIAVAGPVTGDRIPLTNAHWVVEPLKMIDQLQLEDVVILNDFEAQALALPGLSGSDIELIGNGSPLAGASKFVLGPGTGLGAAAMIHAADTWIPVPGEGGHVELGPVTEADFEIWPHVERVEGRVGAEQLLSGTGLPMLARAVATARNSDRHFQRGADITRAAGEGDPVAVETLQMFARCLGRVAGDFALTVLARGGVYITGGVTSYIADYLKDGGFRAAFEAKSPHSGLMASIPTFLIRHPNPALEGLAAFARTPALFAVGTAGRQWTRAGALTVPH